MIIAIPSHPAKAADLPACCPAWMTEFIRVHGGESLPATAYTGDGRTSVTRIMSDDEISESDLPARGYMPFAEDGMGNTISTDISNGSVIFHDHETGTMTTLSPDVDSFLSDLRYEYPGTLPDHEVVSVWTKPGFVPTFD